MFYKPTTRLFAIKFLGLFGSGTAHDQQSRPCQQDSGDTAPEGPVILRPKTDNKAHETPPSSKEVGHAIEDARRRVVSLMLERGVPGVTIAVAKKGQILWSDAFGYCDVENGLECTPDARMRIASISKSVFTATIIGNMIEHDKLDVNSSVHDYLSREEFPKQKFEGKETDITLKQLLSHTSGIRDYGEERDKPLRPIGSEGSLKVYQCNDQYNRTEFYQRKTYRSVVDALEPIRSGPLGSEPGKYKYTSYGFTVASAVAEKVLQRRAADQAKNGELNKLKRQQIEDYWVRVLHREWNMTETNLDQDEPILSNRARYYLRSGQDGRLVNAPYTDNSVKWAGGGLSSTTRDLVKFGTALIDSYKARNSARLQKSTIELLWTEVQDSYCLGFMTKSLSSSEGAGDKRAIHHTGSALGASSVLVLYPESEVVVAILANLNSVNLLPLGLGIADRFAKPEV